MRAYTVEYLDIDKEGDFQWNINRANKCTHLLYILGGSSQYGKKKEQLVAG